VDVERQLRNICWSALTETDWSDLPDSSELVVSRIVQDVLRSFDVKPKCETVEIKQEPSTTAPVRS